MSKVWVLGAGQLGDMLRHAGHPLGIEVEPVDPGVTTPFQPGAEDTVTAEREQWPETYATQQLASHPRFANQNVFARLADRQSQKQLLDDLDLATARWRLLEAQTQTADLYQEFGDSLLLKRRMGGYDGRGQHWMHRAQESKIPDDWRGAAIAEEKIPFDEEVSLVGARDRNGRMVFYPLALNLHIDGILMASVAPVSRLQALQAQAETMLGRLLEALDYVGVMAMECFRVGDQLIINELAPRVHNSGHWTQAGASINQFECHLRAILDLPMVEPAVKSNTVMINLIGVEKNDQWLSIPEAELYWYGKTVRPGRKVGHINLSNNDHERLQSALQNLRKLLPERYKEALDWMESHLPPSA